MGDAWTEFAVHPHGNDIVWESDCAYFKGQLRHLSQWLAGERGADPAFMSLSPDDFWVYASYKHMGSLFAHQPSAVSQLDWQVFGVSGAAEDATFWYGSRGARTACHYDSYGVNLVAQLHGHKHWLLFPPECSAQLRATRVPYEESSVFATAAMPPLDAPPAAFLPGAQQATLSPGDVLFVPRHWWHYVRTLDTAVSVNLWCPHPADAAERVTEALVCCARRCAHGRCAPLWPWHARRAATMT